jgi:type IV pilus assembly protein PilC
MAALHIHKLGSLEKTVLYFFRISLKRKVNFFRLLAVAQNAGLGIRDALLSIRRSETHRGLIIIIDDLVNQLTQGVSFADALRNHTHVFSQDEIELIKSSELVGNMPSVLQDVSIELENLERIHQKIRKALTYPIILLSFTIIAVIILLVFVVPTIVGLFPDEWQLPGITRFMLSVSNFLQNRWFFLAIGLLGIVILYRFLYSTAIIFKIFIDKLSITIPVLSGVTKTYHMYRFSKLLGQFSQGWLSMVVWFGLLKDIFTNFFYQKKSLEIKKDLEIWLSFVDSMEWSTLFDPILVQIIALGQDTGNIDEVLLTMAAYYRDALDMKISILMSLIEPILMSLVAIIIGIVIGSIFLPMAELTSVIQ